MKNNSRAQPVFSLAAFTTLGALLAPVPVSAWDSFTVFGDSLSDTGNVGRYTWDNTTNSLYDEIVARRQGLTLLPSSQGGSNYAAASAMAVPTLNPEYNTQDQVAAWLTAVNGQADPNGLYIHWVGGNDLAVAIAAALASSDLANAVVENSATAAASQVRTVVSAGAGTVIVPTAPDVGETPAITQAILSLLGPEAEEAQEAAFQSLSSAATPDRTSRQQAIETALTQAAAEVSSIPAVRDALAQQLIDLWQTLSDQGTALTESYNQQEEAGLLATQGNIVRVDINALFNELLDQPGFFGLSNTAGMACPPGVTANGCTSSTPGFSRAQSYLFADILHPSPAVHAIIADYIQSVLDAPAQVAALTQAPLMMARDMHNTLDGHLQQQRHRPTDAGEFAFFGGYSGQHRENDGDSGAYNDGDATAHSLTLGIGYQLTGNWQTGVLFSAANDRQQPSSHYDYRLRGNMVALWSQLTLFNQGWINADVHYADLDFDDIERRVTLGPATRTEQGNTGGKLLGLRVQTGWDIPLGSYVTTGPMVSYALDYGHVGGYREQGDSSTAMRFYQQDNHSQIGSVGWRIDTRRWPVNPWAQVSYNHQFGDSDLPVTAGLNSTRTAFSRTVAGPDKNWLDVAVGANVPLGQSISAFAAASTVGGASDYHEVTWNVGINATF